MYLTEYAGISTYPHVLVGICTYIPAPLRRRRQARRGQPVQPPPQAPSRGQPVQPPGRLRVGHPGDENYKKKLYIKKQHQLMIQILPMKL
jgi:hypothetical protein